LFVEMFNLIEHHIGSYVGLRGAKCVERWSMCPVGLYDGCEAKENPCCVKLERQRGGYFLWNYVVAELPSSVPLLIADPPTSSLSSNEQKIISPVCEWSVGNGVEHYHDQLIGSWSLLYEGCEWIV